MPTVLHCADHSRFEICIDDATAVLEYHLIGKIMTIHHTFVPVELRGQNIAGILATAAFDSARSEGLQVVPQCSYIATYAKRHPEAEALIRQDRL
ncbi:MAG: putative GNAT family acetyltransferase [Lentimonas sp.]|jgi:predicted GNAT family acetyltransferase